MEREAGPGVGTMMFDFFCGAAAISIVSYVCLAYYALTRPGGFGLEGVVLLILLVALVVLNGAMVAAVYVGAAAKRRSVKRSVTVRPRKLMFFAGLVAPVAGVLLAWCMSSLFPLMFLGLPFMAAVASVPAGVVTWGLAKPRN